MKLQRGRTHESAETLDNGLYQSEDGELQRGRTHESAETCQEGPGLCECPPCFNGAALMRVRRLGDSHTEKLSRRTASTGPHS